MLKTQVINNTWSCDGLNCPTADSNDEVNPFHRVRIYVPRLDSMVPLEVDLCDFCVQTITAPSVVQYVSDADDELGVE